MVHSSRALVEFYSSGSQGSKVPAAAKFITSKLPRSTQLARSRAVAAGLVAKEPAKFRKDAYRTARNESKDSTSSLKKKE